MGERREILNVDDHKTYIEQSLKKNADRFRPDIVHRCVLSIFDSPLAKIGMVEVYINTLEGAVIQIHPSMRVDPLSLSDTEDRETVLWTSHPSAG